ncbi:Hypothetical protein A7982_10144 [Minicystis rosea]|nr:Hypothetical protein A7982_10144 [Minicystis rosea]
MKTLAATNRDKLIDLLNERLVFERSGVKLYDTIVGNMERSKNPEVAGMLQTMREHRDEEKEHATWLEAQIRALGGDAQAKTEMGELVAAESAGVERVVTTDQNLMHQLHALLTAELVDNAGWELLLQLADEADDDDARREMRRRAHHEAEHLMFVRRAIVAFARRSVLGRVAELPSSP